MVDELYTEGVKSVVYLFTCYFFIIFIASLSSLLLCVLSEVSPFLL